MDLIIMYLVEKNTTKNENSSNTAIRRTDWNGHGGKMLVNL